MVQRTLGDVRATLAQVAGNTGLPVDDQLVDGYVNKAIEELSAKGDWPGVVDRWLLRFDEPTGLMALPSHLERSLQITVDDVPLEMRSPWFEFVQYGPGPLHDEIPAGLGTSDPLRPARRDWSMLCLDRGEAPTRFALPDSPFRLRLTTLADEPIPLDCLVQGRDASGHQVRTHSLVPDEWYSGETITCGTGQGAVTEGTAVWSSIDSVQRIVTRGPVRLEAVDVADGSVTLLSEYEFDDLRPRYRRYFVPALYRTPVGERDRIVLARCRRRFVPATANTDVLMIGNVTALEAMIISQYKASIGELAEAGSQVQRAVTLMREEALAYSGKARVPSITFQRGFFVGEMPSVR